MGVAVGAALLLGTSLTALAFRTRPAPAPPAPEQPSVQVSEAQVPAGASFAGLLNKAGLRRKDNDAAVAALAKVLPPDNIREGRRYQVGRSTDGVFGFFLYYDSPKLRFRLTRGDVGFVAGKEELPVTREVYGVSGTINSSLWNSMKDAGLSEDLIFKFADVFAWQVDFLTEPRKGDKFRVVWERSVVEGKTISDRRILSAAYESRTTGKHFAVLFPGADGKDAYYDLDGRSLQKEFLRAPLQFRRISSRFTERRYHPIFKEIRPHHGVDYAAAYGTPVDSIGDGQVIKKGPDGGLGNAVRIRHPNGYISIYGHMARFAPGISVGKKIKQGQLVGFVGMTGWTTGPHLHFGIERDGRLIDFQKVKLPPAQAVPDAARAEYESVRRRMLSLLGRVETDTRVAQAFTADSFRRQP